MSESGTLVTSVSPVILRDNRDWIKWLEITKTTALEDDVWQYIDPSIARDKLLMLEPPKQPLPGHIKPPADDAEGNSPTEAQIKAVSYSKLSVDEKEHLKNLQREFEYQRGVYDRTKRALGSIRKHIQRTVHADNLIYTYGCELV